jgi:hypothetical protein
MEKPFKVCFVLIPFLILRAVSIVNIKYHELMSLNLATNIQASVITANGQELYVAT